ncbi:MAG: N-acetyl-gamma-glutamyl-phosphate reductase [Syntrophomonadaceae bacterium]|nr:N-acetyl-gamma-glutamyl-phosphate reductase [Syntrophomonadaceae bacterium]
MSAKIKVGIVGDGYTAEELVRLLAGHPEAEVIAITSLFNIGRDFAAVFPNLLRYTEVICESMELTSFIGRCDAIFVALPHGQAVPVVKEAVAQNKKVIDLGADFRFKQVEVYEEWYGVKHEAPELLEEVVYGIPELYGAQVRQARIVANPGCYPTSAILGMAPVLKAGLVDIRTLIVDSKSGVSGAGRTPGMHNLFCEVNENVKAYNVATHRHGPEIEQVYSWLAGAEATLTFTPHLIPMSRGILSTIYASLTRPVTQTELQALYEDFYRDCFFIRVLPEGQLPMTRAVYTTNHCDIGLVIDPRNGRLVVVSAIDNLVKGASGQAIQNLNLMCGLKETCGLKAAGLLP